MSLGSITTQYLTDIANAIRAKLGVATTYKPSQMAAAIASIPSSTPTLQTKTATYTPSGSIQTDTITPDAGYDGLDEVDITVNAMPAGTAGTPTATKSIVSNHAITVTPSVTNSTGYITGSTISGTGVSVSASELVSGTKSITTNGTGIDVTEYASVDVSVSASLQSKTKTYTPSESQQTETVSADAGYDGLQQVGVTVNAIPSNYVGSGVTQRTSSDLTASGATVTAPAGYYASAASKAVASGTAGTPTASKGAVNNHAITVTPSVTNSTGYITGSTITGTAVSVSASELVSGTKSISANGTGIDVTDYAAVDVAVPGATLTTKTITANGTYNASSDSADGYSSVTVNVSGGSSNFVTGTFTTGSSAGVGSVNLPYTGSGYPLMAVVVVENGAYNSAVSGWYTSVQRYAVGQWTMTKSVFTTTPTYTTSSGQNQGVTTWIYKNSTSSSTTYSRSSAMNTNVFSSSNASNAGATCVRLKSGNVLSYYVNTSSYGLLPNTTYRYMVYYSAGPGQQQ